MNKCLCTLAIAGLLAGCRAPYNLADLRFDRTRLAASLKQADEAPVDKEPAPAANDDLKIAADDDREESDGSSLIELASAREPADSVAEDLRRAHAAAANGELDKARAFYERVLAVEPKHAQAHHRLAVLADQRRDYETAAGHYMAALQQEPASADLLNDIGYSFFLQGRLETAQRYLEDAVRAQPSHTRAKANLALVRKRAELIAAANPAPKAAEPAPTPAADASERLHDQIAKTPPQGTVTAHQRESAYPPESPNPVQTVAGESPPGIATVGPPRAALPKIRPHNSEADVATDLFTPLVTPLGQEREPAPVVAAQQVRVPVPPLPAPASQPAVPSAFPVSLRSPIAAPPSDDAQADPAALPSREPLITAEVALRSARYVGMNAGPGNPFSALDPNRPAEVPPVALAPGEPPGPLLAAASSPLRAPRVRITGVSVVPESARPQPHHAAAGITLASNSHPSAGHDPIEQFQRQVQQYHAQRNEIDLRRDAGTVLPAGGTFPATDGVRQASWPDTADEPHWP